MELVERISRTDVPKQHAKFYYEVSYPGNGGQDKILLDVLFEETYYSQIVSLTSADFWRMELTRYDTIHLTILVCWHHRLFNSLCLPNSTNLKRHIPRHSSI